MSRIGSPLKKIQGSYECVSWKDVLKNLFVKFGTLYSKLNYSFYLNKEVDLISMYLIKLFANFLGSSKINTEYLDVERNEFVNEYSLNKDYDFIDRYDQFFFIGLNFKLESPVLNTKLRKRVLKTGLPSYLIGTFFKCNYPLVHLGSSLNTLSHLFNTSKGTKLLSLLKERRVLFLVNTKIDAKYLKKLLENIELEKNFEIKFVSNESNSVGFNDLSVSNSIFNSNYCAVSNKNIKFNFDFLNLEDYKCFILERKTLTRKYFLDLGERFFKEKSLEVNFLNNVNDVVKKNNFHESYLNIYTGIIGDNELLSKSKIDLVLPGLSFVEKIGFYKNIFNDVQRTSIVLSGPKFARSDLDFIKVLCNYFVYFRENFEEFSYNGNNDRILEFLSKETNSSLIGSFIVKRYLSNISKIGKGDENISEIFTNSSSFINKVIYNSIWDNFYSTNLISKNSVVMGNCSKNLNLKSNYNLKENF